MNPSDAALAFAGPLVHAQRAGSALRGHGAVRGADLERARQRLAALGLGAAEPR